MPVLPVVAARLPLQCGLRRRVNVPCKEVWGRKFGELGRRETAVAQHTLKPVDDTCHQQTRAQGYDTRPRLRVRAQQHATAAASYSVALHDGDKVWREARTPLARETDGLVALSLPLSLPKVAPCTSRPTHVTDLIEFTDLIEDELPCRKCLAAPLEVESKACCHPTNKSENR